MRQVYSIDEDGFYVEPIVLKQGESIPATTNCVSIQPPQGLYRARWNGAKWVEGMSEDEIAEMYNQFKPLTETEMLMLAVAELDAQREQDKIETQLAIAELAETLLGGVE